MRRPSVILLDAPGFKVCGEGEWKVKIHGKTKRRKWIKLHISIDETSQEIVAAKVTEGSEADCKVGPTLIEKCGSRVRVVKADGAYDTKNVRRSAERLKAKALIPPRKTAIWSASSPERNGSVAEMRGLGLDDIGRS